MAARRGFLVQGAIVYILVTFCRTDNGCGFQEPGKFDHKIVVGDLDQPVLQKDFSGVRQVDISLLLGREYARSVILDHDLIEF